MRETVVVTETLGTDAIILGLSYLNGPKMKLSFGGEGASNRMTDRARAALNELLEKGYACPAKADDQIVGREHYQGTSQDPHLGHLAKEAGLNPFDNDQADLWQWKFFEKVMIDA